MGQYWWYAVTGATSVKYLVTATRGTKAGGVASTISFAWSDTTGATWGGDHVGKPK
jgi:hypothetical protein